MISFVANGKPSQRVLRALPKLQSIRPPVNPSKFAKFSPSPTTTLTRPTASYGSRLCFLRDGQQVNKAGLLSGILAVPVLSGCGHKPTATAIDMQAARKLSDAFMAELIAHGSDSALDKNRTPFYRDD